ncbi:membrane protein insertase YidC [Spongisporangium articulatum]|uniref:Membrane protein insertase YidC n=1 Tax=Spongisporangium articulatum TaxID=3362603 RepID=A0ABW8AI16_9ACTN
MTEILKPLEVVVAWIMVTFHGLLTDIGLPAESGWTWALSIVGLVVVIRILLIPLFVKQIKASRGLQLVQPEIRKIQQKYKGKNDQASRQAMTQETMAVYREHGTNPFASCLPILLQAPIFFSLFRVLNGLKGIADGSKDPIGAMTQTLASQAEQSTLFGAKLSSTFLGSDELSVKILTVVLIILMSASTFTSQRQLMMKNMPPSALEGPMAQQQKVLLYVLPLIFAVSGVNFPIGVLIYWFTTNMWSMGQQFYTIRRMPAPGSLAEKALNERRAKRGKPAVGAELKSSSTDAETEPAEGESRQRVQPKRQPKSKRSGQQRPGKPTGSSGGAGGGSAGDSAGDSAGANSA